jgi:hypothetical protein
MKNKKTELQELYELWQEAREVAGVLHESWAAVIRGKRLFLQSASLTGIESLQANKMYSEFLGAAQKEYSAAFTRACELSDEYTALNFGVSPPSKKAN